MGILSVASGQSVYRGYEYFRSKKVLRAEEVDENIFKASVSGSDDNVYDVIVNVAHPRKSQCTCPHAAGRRIVCKHMVAAYFAVFPMEADRYVEELEAYWEEEEEAEQRQNDLADAVVKYVSRMKKSELQQELLRILFDGPEWQFERFVDENMYEDFEE